MRFALRNRVYLAVDVLGWTVIPLVALGLRVDGLDELDRYARDLVLFVAIAAPCKLFALWSAGLYRRYWRYAGVDELGLIVVAVLGAGVAAGMAYFALATVVKLGPGLPHSVPVIDALLTLFFVGGTRFTTRLAEHLLQSLRGGGARHRVLIVGAGSAGMMIAKELRANPQLEIEPVGFIDDDPSKHGNKICGLSVFGGRDTIGAASRSYGIDRAIIAMPRASGRVIRELRDRCEKAGITTKTIPGMFDILSGRVRVNQLRDVQIEDVLRREPVTTDQRAVAALVRGMTVLVTGAGGSIGSEICRQVASLGADELLLVGHGENSIFEVHEDLAGQYPHVRIRPVIADIRDRPRIERVFSTYEPHAVFHAAAHKHVPLMELNPEEAVTNNVEGTLNVLSAAEQSGVGRFVFISTDKAVNPVNVMGATKLLAERLVHDAAERTGRPYVSVRFGNVLASRGSVVPLFQRQILAGGPVTVTHPEMTRYFMTIPEAVQLVLQAAALGRSGETFVLDMGEPVRIVDLARDLIHFSGLEVGRDIEIEFTGLRPGEKLNEQLFTTDDHVARTTHEKIFVVRNGKLPPVSQLRLGELAEAASRGDGIRIRYLLAAAVPEYSDPAVAEAGALKAKDAPAGKPAIGG